MIRDPTTMTAVERLEEVAFLLGAAYLRLCLSRRKQLDQARQAEALFATAHGEARKESFQ